MQPTTINVALLIHSKKMMEAAKLTNTAATHDATLIVADLADLVSPQDFSDYRRALRREMLHEYSPKIELLTLVQSKEFDPQSVGRRTRPLTETEVSIVLMDPTGH